MKRLRAGDGVTLLYGRRLSLHIMVQPEVARQFLADGTLRDQGLLSRMLVAAPPSLAGRRLYRSVNPDDDAEIRAYGARILSLLERRWPFVEGKTNELEPRVLPLSSDAAEVWTSFFDHVERTVRIQRASLPPLAIWLPRRPSMRRASLALLRLSRNPTLPR